MEKQVLAVLTELLEEQKEAASLLVGLNSTLNAMQAKLENIEAKVDQGQIDKIQSPKLQTDDQLVKQLNEMQKLLENVPRNVRHEKRLLLFPEHSAKEYYSVVLKWLFYIVVATYCYWVAKCLIERFTD